MTATFQGRLENGSNKEEGGCTLLGFPDIGSLVQIKVENLHLKWNQGLLLIKETGQEGTEEKLHSHPFQAGRLSPDVSEASAREGSTSV